MKVAFLLLAFACCIVTPTCTDSPAAPSVAIINTMNLKRGSVIYCGPPDGQFGTVDFKMSCSKKVKEDFNLAVKLLHSFEYDEAEKVFARVIDAEPGCAMAYWGVAMSNFHALWAPPTDAELKKGAKAIEIAQSIEGKTAEETGYINAIAAFYTNYATVNHGTRCLNFEKAMEALYTKYPADDEAAIFYSLALNAAADPADKTYQKQKKAGEVLNKLYAKEPNHPGIIHYIIHTFDSPELAELSLTAARRYASVAPSSAHALHMPSHIFTRLGLWNECISSNIASVNSAQCYAQSAGIKGHWDEELHGLDYLVYAYLQKGENDSAKKQCDYLAGITEVHPVNFKVAYAYAAMPARYALENKDWKAAVNLPVEPGNLQWENFPWQQAIIRFARLMGAVHTNAIGTAVEELTAMELLRNKLLEQKDAYKANQVAIQIKMGEAWIAFKSGKKDAAIAYMEEAAAMEDKTEKHSVTPGEVLPARELLGDMYMEMNNPAFALEAYKADLKKHPNRFNGLYGAALASAKTGKPHDAVAYYDQLLSISNVNRSTRPELKAAHAYTSNVKL